MNRKEAENYLNEKVVVSNTAGTYAGILREIIPKKPWRGKWEVTHVLLIEYIGGMGYHALPWAKGQILENGSTSIYKLDEFIEKAHNDSTSFVYMQMEPKEAIEILKLIKKDKIDYWKTYKIASTIRLDTMIKYTADKFSPMRYSVSEIEEFKRRMKNKEVRVRN